MYTLAIRTKLIIFLSVDTATAVSGSLRPIPVWDRGRLGPLVKLYHLGQLPQLQRICRCDTGRPLLTFESKRRDFLAAKAAVTVTGLRVTGENPVALSATKRAELLVWMDKIPASRIMAPHCTAIVVANAAIRAIRVTSIATVLTAIIVKMFVLFVAVPTPTSY